MAAALEAAFKVFDTDGSGTLTADELKAVLLRPANGNPSSFTSDSIDEMLAMFDSNGDGVLSIEEFVAAMSSNSAEGRPTAGDFIIVIKTEADTGCRKGRVGLVLEDDPTEKGGEYKIQWEDTEGGTDGLVSQKRVQKLTAAEFEMKAANQVAMQQHRMEDRQARGAAAVTIFDWVVLTGGGDEGAFGQITEDNPDAASGPYTIMLHSLAWRNRKIFNVAEDVVRKSSTKEIDELKEAEVANAKAARAGRGVAAVSRGSKVVVTGGAYEGRFGQVKEDSCAETLVITIMDGQSGSDEISVSDSQLRELSKSEFKELDFAKPLIEEDCAIVIAGEYEGRFGEVSTVYRSLGEGYLRFRDKLGGTFSFTFDKVKKITSADMAAMAAAEWEPERAALKAAGIPAVGELRKDAVHEQWRSLPWFDAWVAGGSNHQQLGMSIEGIARLLSHDVSWVTHPDTTDTAGTGLTKSYTRDEDALGWVTSAFGTEFTGYDLCYHVRRFLEENEQSDKSLFEVILARGPSYTYKHYDCTKFVEGTMFTKQVDEHTWVEYTESFDWTQHVGPAHVFYSHIQSTSIERTVQCMRDGLEMNRTEVSKAPMGERFDSGVFFWLDYFVLRQCLKDFDLNGTRQVIKDIGCTFVELDHDPLSYLTRSFCILEAFASVESKATICVTIDYLGACRMASTLNRTPVDSKAAETRSRAVKEAIDGFIETMPGGFGAVNEAITAKMIDAGQRVIHLSKKQVACVNLSFSKLGRSAVPEILDLISTSDPTLETISVHGNRFSIETCNALVAAASRATPPKLLTVRRTAGARDAALIEWAERCCNLTDTPYEYDALKFLSLFNLNVDAKDAVLIAYDIANRPDLEVVNLGRNSFGDIGASKLAEPIAQLANLKVLDLVYCDFSKKGVATVKKALKEHKRKLKKDAMDLDQL